MQTNNEPVTVYKVNTFGSIRWYFEDDLDLSAFRQLAADSGSEERKCMSPKEKRALQRLGVDFILKECEKVKDRHGQQTGAYMCPSDGWTPPFQDDSEYDLPEPNN